MIQKSPYLILSFFLIIGINLIYGQYNGHDYQQNDPRIGGMGGFVDVDVHNTYNGGKHVGVHVPVFYSMDLDKGPHRTGLGINVLDGLVKVRVKKNPYKDRNGVLVALAGIPLWNSE